ncbi:MAG TPA: hypothetical protein VNI58_07655 [Mariprofundaceae bacterium]|nr:hypothetical protein [Mariprofundaceae bacterium]
MQQVEKNIDEYLQALTAAYGTGYRRSTRVEDAGGGDVVITDPQGSRELVSIGHLQLMTEHLRQLAKQKLAA